MDYQRLINKLNETSRRVKQLEAISMAISGEIEDGNMDLIVLNILEEAINKINALYNNSNEIDCLNVNGTLKEEL
tara:strand:+ start:229 stop:453 length:225 start_codon:yes stop_codon:yes gene_type:complete